MDIEAIKQLAMDVNNVAAASFQSGKEHIERPLLAKIERLETELQSIRLAATKWSRCCDLWQDGLGGMHCRKCGQKTFTMLRNIQTILKVNKDCNLIK